MDQKWIQVLVILAFYQEMTFGATVFTLKEGQSWDIKCVVSSGTSMVTWFRIGDSGIKFIGSFNKDLIKASGTILERFDIGKIAEGVLKLRSFNKSIDSGAYSCSFIKSNVMVFGEVQRLVGEKAPVTAPPPAPNGATQPCPSTTTTTTSCNCDGQGSEGNPSLHCPLIILGPLAGGCGLLLLLLIATTLYCNKIRTRRCPHHYKKRPRATAPEKVMMTNRHF